MASASESGVHIRPELRTQFVDQRIASIAARQDSIITHRQLNEIGLGKQAIRHRIRVGRLHFVFVGVYSVGVPAISERGRLVAACLSTEPSFVSHRNAGEFHRLVGPIPGPIHVTVAQGRALRRDGIVVHRTRHLHKSERWVRDALRVTSPARTLVDLAGTCTGRALTHAYDESQRLARCSPGAVLRACARSRGRPGVPLLRALAEETAPSRRHALPE